MNIDVAYYDACYKLCVLNTIKNAKGNFEEVPLSINDNLSVITSANFQYDLYREYPDLSTFKMTIIRDGVPVDSITFKNDFKKALVYQEKLWDSSLDLDKKIEAMEALSPSKLMQFLKRKPAINDEEMNLIIAKADEIERELLDNNSNQNSRHM